MVSSGIILQRGRSLTLIELAANAQRKTSNVHDTHGQYSKLPKLSPAELSRMKAEKDAHASQQLMLERKRQEEVRAQHLQQIQQQRLQQQGMQQGVSYEFHSPLHGLMLVRLRVLVCAWESVALCRVKVSHRFVVKSTSLVSSQGYRINLHSVIRALQTRR